MYCPMKMSHIHDRDGELGSNEAQCEQAHCAWWYRGHDEFGSTGNECAILKIAKNSGKIGNK